MSGNELLVKALEANWGFVKMTLADMSDEELLMRPVVGANHGNWQIGHLIRAEFFMFSSGGAKMPELPAGLMEKYEQKNNALDGAENFLTKDVLLATFEKVRLASMEWLKGATEEQLAAASPERIRKLAPTIGELVTLTPTHVAMHVGQIQVLRRKLGKPVLF